MSNKMIEKFIEVDPKEILFFYQNCDSNVKNIIFDNLSEHHPTITKRLVDKELTKLKRRYDSRIIGEARRVLQAVKNVQFNNN